ncbi:MAG: RecX family transcriptional regulator [Candidatus Helarchaeales archaeon]
MEKIITSLEVQKKNANRINVYLDHEFAFGISRIVGTRLKQGEKLDESSITQLLEKDTREKAFQKALNYLSYRPRSVQEVKQKIEELGFCESVIKTVVSELLTKNYLNDREFAENWISSRVRSKPRSQKMIRFELRKKFIPEDVIEEALEIAPGNDELAFRLGKKYLRRFAHIDEKDFIKKMTGVLARRAFSFSEIKTVLKKLIINRDEST